MRVLIFQKQIITYLINFYHQKKTLNDSINGLNHDLVFNSLNQNHVFKINFYHQKTCNCSIKERIQDKFIGFFGILLIQPPFEDNFLFILEVIFVIPRIVFIKFQITFFTQLKFIQLSVYLVQFTLDFSFRYIQNVVNFYFITPFALLLIFSSYWPTQVTFLFHILPKLHVTL